MPAPSGGIPKHERVLVLLEIIKSMGTAEFDILSIRFAARTYIDLTPAVKRALYRDLQELVQENRLDEIKIDARGEILEADADLNRIVAKSAWRIRDTEDAQNFWGENVLKKEELFVSGSSFLVSALSAQVSMDSSDRRCSYLLFGTQYNLVLKLPKDLAPFVIIFGRAQKAKKIDFTDINPTRTNISNQIDLPPPISRELLIGITGSSVSRKHCSIKFDLDQSVSITDFGSANFTRIVSKEPNKANRQKNRPGGPVISSEHTRTANLTNALSSAVYLEPGLPLKISAEVLISCGTYQFGFIP